MFLGTPFYEAGLASWADFISIDLVERKPFDGIHVLKHASAEITAQVRGDFLAMLDKRYKANLLLMKVVCFYEELPSFGEDLDRFVSQTKQDSFLVLIR